LSSRSLSPLNCAFISEKFDHLAAKTVRDVSLLGGVRDRFAWCQRHGQSAGTC
jgi:hypothetical protein